MKRSESIGHLMGALVKARSEVGYLQKDGTNTHGRYNYLSEAKVADACREAFDKHGIALWTETELLDRAETTSGKGGKAFFSTIRLTVLLVHVESGEWLESVHTGVGHDSLDKDPWKAITGAFKYVLFKGMMISSGDDPEADDDGDEPGREVKKIEANPEAVAAVNKEVEGIIDMPVSSAVDALINRLVEHGMDRPVAIDEMKLYADTTGRKPTDHRKVVEAYLFARRTKKAINPVQFARIVGGL